MRLGIVDLGTLSLRLDIADTAPNQRPNLVARYRSMPRLGDHLFEAAELADRTVAAVVAEFQKVKEFSNSHGAHRIIAVGTGVLRDSPLSGLLLDAILQQTGIEIRILSGAEEAELTAGGIFANEPSLPDRLALVDIGGGSTEISFCEDRKLSEIMSLNVGALRLEKECLRGKRAPGKPYPEQTLSALRSRILGELRPLAERSAGRISEQIVGSSGTIRTLEKLGVCSDSQPPLVTKDLLNEFFETICRLSLEETLALPQMEPARADVILPGACILLEVMNILKVNSVRVTHYSLRHGVLEEAMGTNILPT